MLSMIREALTMALDLYFEDEDGQPIEPNATRVRLTGGVRNKVGELEGQAREEYPVRVIITDRKETLELLGGGQAVRAAARNAIMLEEALEVGDVLEVEGARYEVKEVEPVVADVAFAWIYHLEVLGRG